MARMIFFWGFENIIFFGRILKFLVQFWHPSDLRLWRIGYVIYVKKDWWISNAHCSRTCHQRKIKKLLILPSLRTIYNRTFQCETLKLIKPLTNKQCILNKWITQLNYYYVFVFISQIIRFSAVNNGIVVNTLVIKSQCM